MSSDHEYCEKAAHCQRMADAARTDEIRAQWLTLAERWLAMVKGDTGRDNVLRGDFESKPTPTLGEQLKRA